MSEKQEKVHRGMFPTEAEAQAAKPEGTKLRMFRVTKDGTTRVTWAGNHEGALAQAAKVDGYACSAVGKAPDKEKLAAGLAALDPETRAILIAQYVPAPSAPEKKGSKK
jgi:hypothetical protein